MAKLNGCRWDLVTVRGVKNASPIFKAWFLGQGGDILGKIFHALASCERNVSYHTKNHDSWGLGPSSNLAFLSLHLDSPWSFYQFLHWLMACLGNSFACSQSLCFTNQDWNLDVTRQNQTWNKLFVFDVRFNAAGYLATLATCSRANRWAEADTWAYGLLWLRSRHGKSAEPHGTQALEMTQRTQPHREGYAPGRLEDWMIGSVWKMSLRLHVCYGKLTYCNSS